MGETSPKREEADHVSSLIIPMLVEAYACGDIRPMQKDIPVMAPNYKTALFRSVLGSQNTPGAMETASPLEAGIHLHFMLPDAFTHSADGADYPAVPNRYIVTRAWRDGDTGIYQTKAFVVESDFISTDSVYEDSITIPYFTDPKPRKRWRYLGRCYPAGRRPSGEACYLDKLTALGPGDPMFAAYYPNCRSVFGFYDDLRDLPVAPLIELTYFVMGFFSSPEADPLSQGKTAEAFENIIADLGLSVGEQGFCDSSLVYGAVDSIQWKGFQAEYCPTPQGKVHVVFGNTSAEALSYAVKHSLETEFSFTERMLTVLQYEMNDQMDGMDGNFKIDDEIHYQGFSRWDGFGKSVHVSLDKDTVLETQDGMGMAYTLLEEQGAALGESKRELYDQRKKLFALWEQYVLIYEKSDVPMAGYPSKERLLAEMRTLCDKLVKGMEHVTALEDRYHQAAEEFSKAAPDGVTCGKGGTNPFLAPKDPVLLMSGPGLKRSFAYGEDGRFTTNGSLFCQMQPIKSSVAQEKIFRECFSDLEYMKSLPADYPPLLLQTLLICPTCLAGIKELLGDIQGIGEPPSPIAVNQEPLDWTTLFMIWRVDYHSTRRVKNPDNTMADWHMEYGDTNLTYRGGMSPEQLKSQSIAGKMVLTPHAVKVLGSVVSRYGEIHGNEEKMKEFAAKIKELPVISQNLSGFSDYFSGFRQTLQFPIMGIGDDDDLTKDVAALLGDERLSVVPDGELMPLRGGYVKISDLVLVSSFGQTQPLVRPSYYNNCKVDFAETVACDKEGYGLLSPSFTVPVRLNAAFVSAAQQEVLTSAAPETSPVIGILIPELLNRRLLVYSAAGRYLGMVKTVYRGGEPDVRWLSAPGMDPDFDKLDIPNRELRAFLEKLKNDGNAFYEFSGLLDQYLDAKHHFGSLVWGRPLVLAKVKADFEFFGAPQCSKRFEDAMKYDSFGAEHIVFPLKFGDINRVGDGLMGCYDGQDYTVLYAPYGAQNPCGTEHYVRYNASPSLSKADGNRYFTLLLSPDAPTYIQTGILPAKPLYFEAGHAKAAENLALMAEISPILGTPGEVGLPPLPVDKNGEGYKWYVPEDETYVKNKLIPPMVSFENTILMDGFIVKEGE